MPIPSLLLLSIGLISGDADAFAPSSQCWVGSRRNQVFLSSSRPITELNSMNESEQDDTKTVRAALFQSPVHSNYQVENPLAALTQVADSLRVASMHGVDLVLYPELFLSGGSSERAMDRECYELNIVGNMCGELNIACLIGYSENIHESELKNTDGATTDGKADAYNSIAAFNADGSRAGNYRSVTSKNDNTNQEFRTGHPFVESIPTLLTLPNNRKVSSDQEEVGPREIKVGMMCGNDILSPEHCRHLVHGGAQALLALTSFGNTDHDLRMVKCVIPTRAMENNVPFLYANPEQKHTDNNGDNNWVFAGSSAIVSKDGSYLVCAPREEGGDMPCDSGYLIPCEVGALFAADLNLAGDGVSSLTDQWELSPCIPNEVHEQLGNRKRREQHRETNGFGQVVARRGKSRRAKK